MGQQRHVFVAEINPHELAVRMVEAELQRPRPAGMSAHEALMGLGEEHYDGLMRMAEAAARYFTEILGEMKREQ
jgi:hypothetical protein